MKVAEIKGKLLIPNKKVSIIIFFVTGAMILLGIFILFNFRENNTDKNEFSAISDIEKYKENIFAEVTNFCSEKKYDKAIDLLSDAVIKLKNDSEIIERKAEVTEEYRKYFFTTVSEFLVKKEYDKAIDLLSDAVIKLKNDSEIIEKKAEVTEEYKQYFLLKVSKYLSEKKYDNALFELSNALIKLNYDSEIIAKKDEITEEYKQHFFIIVSDYLSKKDFDNALGTLKVAQSIFDNDKDINDKIFDVNKAKIFDKVAKEEENGDYAEAITYLNNISKELSDDIDIKAKLISLKITYKDNVLKESKKSFKSLDYVSAINILKEANEILENDNDLTNALDFYTLKSVPYKLTSLKYDTSIGEIFFPETDMDDLGNTRINNISGDFTNIYDINEEYGKIEGVFYQRNEYKNRTNCTGINAQYIQIYGDGVLLYEAFMNGGIEPISFSVKIEGVKKLKIRLKCEYEKSSYFYYYRFSALSNVNLYK